MKTIVHSAAAGALLLAGAVALPGTASAQMTAETTTALNLRTGPGVRYEIATTMPAGARVQLGGCEANGRWCQVSWQNWDGWASSRYLEAERDGAMTIVGDAFDMFPTVTFDGDATAVEAEMAGAMSTPAGVRPPTRVGNYVSAHPTNMRYLEGEVVVGARLPSTVALHPVPNWRDQYAYVNGQIVMVDPMTRAITYVYA